MPRKKKEEYLVKLDMNLVPDWGGHFTNKIWIDIKNQWEVNWSTVFIDLLFDERIKTALDLAAYTWASDDQKKAMLTYYIKQCQDLLKGMYEKPDQA